MMIARIVEACCLAVVCAVLFFVGQDRFDLIKTEGLRAIVVAEMLEHPGISMPSVHHQPQTKKPPLYAWGTTTLARALGETKETFDEQTARIPSAVAGMLLVLLIYAVGEAVLGRHAGIIAAAFALASPTVVDYSMRAELDMGFTFLTTACILLAYPALRKTGPASIVCWMLCYLAATLAAFWKGPHSLFFLWAALLVYAWRRRHWRWLWNPGQIAGLTLCLGLLVGWTVLLSGHAGGKTVGQTAAIEFASRLLPHKAQHFVSILFAIPMMAIILLPASALIAASLRSGVLYEAADKPESRSAGALWRFSVNRLRNWWRAMAAEPFVEFLLIWLVANMAWSAVVPAKAPRYWLPMFPPAFLIAAYILRCRLAGRVSPEGQSHLDVAWGWIYGVIGAVGLVGLVTAVAAFAWPDMTIIGTPIGPAWAWLTLATGWLAMAALVLAYRSAFPTVGRCVGLLVVVIAVKPVLTEVWWPARSASDSQRAYAAVIDTYVPPTQPVLVLGRHELPDVEFYSSRRFEWPGDAAKASAYTAGPAAYGLLRSEDIQECLTEAGFKYEEVFCFERADKQLCLVRFQTTAR